MKAIIKYILPAVFSLCMSQCFSQKVLVLRNTRTESKDGNVYLLRGPFDSAEVYHRNINNEFVIPIDHDSVHIYGIDESAFNMYNDTKRINKPPDYFIDHIQSFRSDKIILSGLSFEDYFYQRTLTADSSGTKAEDTISYTKPIYISPEEHKAFPESLPYPEIKINGVKAGNRLTLIRNVGTATTMTFINGATSKYTYEQLNFTFNLDLGKNPK
jgi:hypothetical protein